MTTHFSSIESFGHITAGKGIINHWDMFVMGDCSFKKNLLVEGETMLGSAFFSGDISLQPGKSLKIGSEESFITALSSDSLLIHSEDIHLQGDVSAGIIEAEHIAESQLSYSEDFLEAPNNLEDTLLVKACWIGGGNGGTQAVTGGRNGIIKLSTGAVGGQSSSLTFAGAAFSAQDSVLCAEFRIRIDSITDITAKAGLYGDGDNYLLLGIDQNQNLHLYAKKTGSSERVENTGVALSEGEFVVIRFYLDPLEEIEISINGSRVLEQLAIEDYFDLETPVKPYFYADNKTADEDRHLDIDYVKIWQKR